MPAHPLLIVAGATGSGKSELALRMAEVVGGEIVNCDSLQIYRHFNIGAAKLPEAEWRGIPHHLIDAIDPAETFTAGDYARMARARLGEIAARQRVPIVAGGTGFYLRALLEGLFAGPPRNDSLRAILMRRESRHAGFLHRVLRRLDPAAAARIHLNDINKLTRAVEVCLLEGRPISRLFDERRSEALTGFTPVKIGLAPDRTTLNRRLDARCQAMFDHGLVAEVQHILALGYRADIKPFAALGYRQALQYVRGGIALADAVAAAQTATRQYAKRQMTWFRRDPEIHWLAGFGGDAGILPQALAKFRSVSGEDKEG
ncbi:MAG: tRNA (adenosine(37)-N6)-dimethylallyltransferase MiaA [Bryobacteraceae bacterium]